MTPCSCGCKEPHVIVERRTADGVTVCLWSDGDVTGRLGSYPRGLGRIKTPSDRAVQAGRFALDRACLYDWRELAHLVKTARKAAEQTSFPSDTYVRRKMAGEKFRRHGSVVRAV